VPELFVDPRQATRYSLYVGREGERILVDRNRPARYEKLGPMLLQTVVPMMAYRLRPSREGLGRATRAILTEPDDLAERQLGAIYRHVKLDTQLPRMATEEELRDFGGPVALFASEQDVFFPDDAVVARAQVIVPNLVVAECLRGSKHVPTKAALGRVNEEILAFLEDHDGR
jgi:hypothetical protein